MVLEELFIQIAAVIVATTILSFVFDRLKQPLIIAYIITGVLIGPHLLQWTEAASFFQTLSKIGIAFLLFMVGLNLDWKHIKEVGWISLAVGLGQVVFTSLLGFGLAHLLGFALVTSMYIGMAFTFSSTIIIVKLLSDKEDLERLYGRISVGFLIVQDLIAILILLFLSALHGGGSIGTMLGMAFVKWLIVVLGLAVISFMFLPKVTAYAARNQELLFLFSIAWCFGLAATLSFFGFGISVGALLAGIALDSSGWSKELTGKIRPLRDFFLIIFFVLLGTNLTFVNIGDYLWQTIAFSLFILLGNPLIVMLILRALGYHPRTGFMAGTTVAQVSEFSFILIGAGIGYGHIPASILTFTTMVALVTITASSYVISFNEEIYTFISPLFKWLEPKVNMDYAKRSARAPEIILFGYHPVGEILLPKVQAMKRPYAVVDFDPLVLEHLSKMHVPNFYGDAGDPNFLSDIKLERTKVVISTVPDEEVSLQIAHYLRLRKYKGSVIVTVKTLDQAEHLYREGATFVIVPNVLSGERFADMLKKNQFDQKGWKSSSQRRLVKVLDTLSLDVKA